MILKENTYACFASYLSCTDVNDILLLCVLLKTDNKKALAKAKYLDAPVNTSRTKFKVFEKHKAKELYSHWFM